MKITVEPDSDDDPEDWIDMTADDLALTESPFWKLETYLTMQRSSNEDHPDI